MPSEHLTILTIEDEPMIRETIAAYLENPGYRVRRAENGRLGLEAFAAHKPDLAIEKALERARFIRSCLRRPLQPSTGRQPALVPDASPGVAAS